MIRNCVLILAIGLSQIATATERFDHYATLGLGRDASAWAITRRYLRLRLEHNAIRCLLSRKALIRRSEIETAHHCLSHPGLRRNYDELVKGIEAADKKLEVLNSFKDPQFAARFTKPSQIHALQIAMDLDGGDAVNNHYNELLQFVTPNQVAALKLTAGAIGYKVASHYARILALTDPNQVGALAAMLQQYPSFSPAILDLAAKIDTPERLQRFGDRLAAHHGDVARLLASCDTEFL